MNVGLAHFWAQGDAVTHFVAILLLGLSLASWYVMAGKIHASLAGAALSRTRAPPSGAESLPAAIDAIRARIALACWPAWPSPVPMRPSCTGSMRRAASVPAFR